jgi:HAD superfamily hydrolase (TIGR01549 family)
LTVDWRRIELVIFDVDGTLYGQSGLRRRMGLDLAKHVVLKRDFLTPIILREFRKFREELADGDSRTFAHCAPELVQDVVATWIEARPLAYLRNYRVPGIEHVFEALHRRGRRIAILSDYPAKEKLAALGLRADLAVSASDQDVMALKPNPAGLAKILERTSLAPERALMIGDRFDRDWKAAEAAGIDCLIRSRHPDPRAYTFRDYRDSCFKPLIELGT